MIVYQKKKRYVQCLQNSVRKKSFGGTFTFSNCHIIGLYTVGLVFLVSD
jgi:hypothetical protein